MYHGTAHTQKVKATQWYSPLQWLASVNLLHRDIRIYIHQAVLYSFSKVLTRRICLIINIFFSRWSFTIFLLPYCAIQWWYCIEKLDAVSLWGQRTRNFVLFLRHSVQNLRFFFVQRNIDGVNNCTVDSNLTFTPQILYSIRNQERICPLLYNYIIQIRKGTLTDHGFFFLPE